MDNIKLSKAKSIETIASVKGAYEMWDDMISMDCNPSSFILRVQPSIMYKMRLLGPFIPIKSFYVPEYFPSSINIDAIKNGDIKELQHGIDIIRANIVDNKTCKDFFDVKIKALEVSGYSSRVYYNPEDLIRIFKQPLNRNVRTVNVHNQNNMNATALLKAHNCTIEGVALDFFQQLINNYYLCRGGQKCIATNIIHMDNNNAIMIMILGKRMMESLLQAMRRRGNESSGNMCISGIHAHTINMQKNGMGLATQYNITLEKNATFLSPETLTKIERAGLFDISSVFSRINKSKGRYCYELGQYNYKMPSELYDYMMQDLKTIEEDQHINSVEEDISQLPREAFENMPDPNKVVQWIEI